MAKIKIVIDPGHGGNDRANRGPTGYVEADGVLAISKYLRDELLATGLFDVKLTRESDMTLGLTQRGKIAAGYGADLFISEHTNASGSAKKVSGAVVFTSINRNDDALGTAMVNAIANELGIPSLGCRKRPSETRPGYDYYTVMDVAVQGGVKHMLLIESAFHDHPGDEALLKQDSVLRRIAKAQARVICDFFIKEAIAPQSTALRPGTKSNEVAKLQADLNKLGANLVVDGAYGNATTEAVKAFQAKYGLTQDGIAGPKTLAAIENALKAAQTAKVLKSGSSGEEVRQLQINLNNLGYHLVVDGKFGKMTETAVKDFQRVHGLTQDGVVGPATLTAIDRALEKAAKKAIEAEQKKQQEQQQLEKDRQTIIAAVQTLPREKIDAILSIIRGV